MSMQDGKSAPMLTQRNRAGHHIRPERRAYDAQLGAAAL